MTSCAPPCRQFNGGDTTLQPVLPLGWICSSRSNITDVDTIGPWPRNPQSSRLRLLYGDGDRGDEGIALGMVATRGTPLGL
jgi:hypothetical protein